MPAVAGGHPTSAGNFFARQFLAKPSEYFTLVGIAYDSAALRLVISFSHGCYVCRCSRRFGPYVGQPYNFSLRCPLAGANISKLFWPAQIAYNENIMDQGPTEQEEV
jgi:hypothetical protein